MADYKDKIYCIIQSRISSSRLPAKALLNISNIPATILCAKRIGRSGLDYVVSTSIDESDDILVDALQLHDVKFHRGDLDDLHQRSYDAVKNLDDDRIIVRLTADNLLADSDFVEKFVKYYIDHECEYLTSIYNETKLPYGLTAQACRAGHIKDIYENSSDRNFTQRDLFSDIAIKYGVNYYFDDDFSVDLSFIRATLDNYDDFIRISHLFKKFDDVINVSYKDLIAELRNDFPDSGLKFKMKNNVQISDLSLGCAQLGFKYGIVNQRSQAPDFEESREIVKYSIESGVKLFDTALVYGDSEEKLGYAMDKHRNGSQTIITKLPNLSDIDENSTDQEILSQIESKIYKSCHNLKVDKIDFLLLHNYQDKFLHNQKIWNNLLKLRDKGVIKNLGASFYEPKDVIEALKDNDIKFIQIPFNLLDQRWLDEDFLNLLSQRKDIIVQARSALLQGLLATNNRDNWPKLSQNYDLDGIISGLEKFRDKFNKNNLVELCYSYARSKSWIDTIVVGIENIDQLQENIEIFSQDDILDLDQQREIENFFSDFDLKELINPQNWS